MFRPPLPPCTHLYALVLTPPPPLDAYVINGRPLTLLISLPTCVVKGPVPQANESHQQKAQNSRRMSIDQKTHSSALRAGSTRRRNFIKSTNDVYRLIVGSCRLVGTNQWILALFWRATRHFILYLVGRRSGLLGKIYSTM